MEIYKLSDSVDKIKTASPRLASSRPSLRGSSLNLLPLSQTVSDDAVSNFVITDIRQGVKNPNRANIFINDKYAFSLDISQVVDFKLKVGLEISEKELAEYKKASEFGKLYQRTLEWVLMRPRSVRETKDYLNRKLKTSSSDSFLRARLSSTIRGPRGERYGAQSLKSLPVGRERSSEDISEFSQTILDRLIEKGYIDDTKFARYYVENRFVKKGISRKRLKMELMKKGISKEIIDEVVDARDDEEEILKIIAKKRAKYDDDKLIQYLCRQGFSYQLAQSLVTREKD